MIILIYATITTTTDNSARIANTAITFLLSDLFMHPCPNKDMATLWAYYLNLRFTFT